MKSKNGLNELSGSARQKIERALAKGWKPGMPMRIDKRRRSAEEAMVGR